MKRIPFDACMPYDSPGGSEQGQLPSRRKSAAVGSALTVVLDDPERVELGDTVGRARVEGGGLRLGDLLDLSVELRGRGLRRGEISVGKRVTGSRLLRTW